MTKKLLSYAVFAIAEVGFIWGILLMVANQ